MADGVVADGVVADGVVADGVVADGVGADGVGADGVVADGVVAVRLPFHSVGVFEFPFYTRWSTWRSTLERDLQGFTSTVTGDYIILW